MKISQIIDKINDQQLFVPAFQREYVWKRNDAKNLIEQVQDLEYQGFQFEAADGSLYLLMNKIKGQEPSFFD